MKRPGCLLTAIFLALLLGGGQEVFTALTNRSAVEVAISDFEATKPDAKWLRVTGGKLDVLDAAYTEGRVKKTAKELFIPYIPDGADEDGRTIHLLIRTKDPELMRVVEEGRTMEKKLQEGASEEEKTQAALSFLVKNVENMTVSRPVEGVVEFGMDSKSKERDQVKKLFPNLAADFVLLKEGAKPKMGVGVIMLLAAAGLGYFIFRPGKSSAPPPLPGVMGSGVPGMPPGSRGPPPLPPSRPGPPPLPPPPPG